MTVTQFLARNGGSTTPKGQEAIAHEATVAKRIADAKGSVVRFSNGAVVDGAAIDAAGKPTIFEVKTRFDLTLEQFLAPPIDADLLLSYRKFANLERLSRELNADAAVCAYLVKSDVTLWKVIFTAGGIPTGRVSGQCVRGPKSLRDSEEQDEFCVFLKFNDAEML